MGNFGNFKPSPRPAPHTKNLEMGKSSKLTLSCQQFCFSESAFLMEKGFIKKSPTSSTQHLPRIAQHLAESGL